MANFQEYVDKVLGRTPDVPLPPTPKEMIASFFITSAEIIGYIGAAILLLGVLVALIGIIIMIIKGKSRETALLYGAAVRFMFFLFIGIGFLLVRGIIVLVFSPSLADGIVTVALLGIGVVASYFLRRSPKGDTVAS